MTLDEAIHYFEKEAEGYESIIKFTNDGLIHDTDISKCKEHISENRQLAEWLRELSKWRVIKEGIYSLCDVDCEYPQYKDSKTMCDACPIGSVIDYFERIFEEVKADEDSD